MLLILIRPSANAIPSGRVNLGLGGTGSFSARVLHAEIIDRVTRRQLIEDGVPSHVVRIFTTTSAGEKLLFEESLDADPLVSRCVRLELDTRGLDVYFARRARKIARTEGLDTRPIHDYVELVRVHNCNLRAVLQEIEAGVFD